MDFDLSEVNKLIRSRRTIYPEQFSAKQVSKDIILELLENARWAPTHGLTQPWLFKIFFGKGLKTYIDFHSHNITMKFDREKFEKLKSRAEKASAIICIGMRRQASEKIREIEEVEAVACAVQNMFLTATAHGLAFYWGSGALTYSGEMKNFLGLGQKDQCLGSIFIGYPAVEWPASHRKPIESFSDWVE